MAEQQRQLLGRRHQDVGRTPALPLPARDRRIAGARLGADRQAPSPRSASSGCAPRRRPAPSAARYRACAGRGPCWRASAAARLSEARQEPGQRLAGAGRRDQQGRARAARPPRSAPADAAAGSQPRAANQPANGSGSGGATGGPACSRGRRTVAAEACLVVLIRRYATLRCRNGSATMLRAGGHVTRPNGAAPAAATDREENDPMDRNTFLGGSVLGVLVRLIVLSIVVGVVLSALGITPQQHLLPVQHPVAADLRSGLRRHRVRARLLDPRRHGGGAGLVHHPA